MYSWLKTWWMICILACLTMTDGASASSGVVLEYASRDTSLSGATAAEADHEPSGWRLDIEEGNVLVSFQSASPRRLLYLGEQRMLILLNDEKKTFSQVDREILVVLDRHLDQQDTDLRLRLIQLPDQPRRIMADVLEEEEAARASRAAWSPWQVTSTGEWSEEEGHRSLRYDVHRSATKLGELWVAKIEDLSIDEADTFALRDASALIDQLLVTASGLSYVDGREVLGFDINPLAPFAFQHGVPVRIRRHGDDTKYEKILESVRPRQRDDGPVDIPAGYRPEILGPQ